MKTLILILSLLIPSYRNCLNLDLVIVADVSGSVTNNKVFLEQAIREFTDKYKGTTVRISLITFSEKAKVQFHLGDTININIVTGGNTLLSNGLNLGLNELISERAYPENNKLVIIISDFDFDDKEFVMENVTIAKTLNIPIWGIMIDNYVSKEDLMEEVCSFHLNTDYKNLAEEIKKLKLCL